MGESFWVDLLALSFASSVAMPLLCLCFFLCNNCIKVTCLIGLLKGLKEKTQLTFEDGACPPGALGKCQLSMGWDMMLCVSFRGDREGREHQGAAP